MTIKSVLSISLFVIMICFISCKTPLYYPNVVNTPHFNEKGEAEIIVAASSNGGEVQASYAVLDDVAIIGNINGNKRDNENNVDIPYEGYTGEYHSHYFGEIGLAKWVDLEANSVLGCAVGYGYGSTRFKYWDGYRGIGLQRFYMQPYFGGVAKNMEFYLASRITYVDVGNSNVFIEPTMTFKLGLDKLKLFWQLGFVNQLGDQYSDNHIPTQGFLISLGATYKFKKASEN